LITCANYAFALLLLTDVKVDLLEGPPLAGELKVLDEDSVTLITDGAEVTRRVDDVLKVVFSDAPAPPVGLQVLLHDGSRIAADGITATASDVRLTSAAIEETVIERQRVRGLLLKKLASDTQPQWAAFLKRDNERDLLVVQKRDEPGLDFLTGIVSGVTEENVPFLLDGSEIPVPRERIVGVVFGRADKADGRPEGARIQMADGSAFYGADIFVEDGVVSFEAGWGEFVEIPLEQLAAVDYSVGRFHYLSDLPALKEAYFGLQPEGDAWGDQFEADRSTRLGLSSPWRMSRDRFPNTGRPPLTLRGQRYTKGLCIFPSARIEFALDGRYSALQAVVGVDDDVAFNQRPGQPVTAVELRIEKDGETVTKKLVRASDEPFRLNVDLTEANTLSLVVDFGDGSSVCDYLDLAEARLIVNKSAK